MTRPDASHDKHAMARRLAHRFAPRRSTRGVGHRTQPIGSPMINDSSLLDRTTWSQALLPSEPCKALHSS